MDPGSIVPIDRIGAVQSREVNVEGTVTTRWEPSHSSIAQVGVLEDDTGRTTVTSWRESGQPRLDTATSATSSARSVGLGHPYAIVQQINFAVLSGSILALAIGVHSWFGDGRRPRVGTVLLGVLGVCVLLAGVFPENAAVPDSTTNVLHIASSMVGFIAGIGGISLVSRRIVADDRWPTVRYELTGTLVIVLVTFVVSTYSVIIDSAFLGLTQRVFIGVMTLWMVMQSLRLYRRVDAPERSEPGEKRTEPTEAKTAD